MQFIVFVLAYPLLWLISILPFPMLYAFSDFIYLILYKLLGYRKKVVRANLRLALPEKNEEELLQIEKRFYHHLCDLFLEMIKTMSASKEELKKRYIIENIEPILALEKQNKSIIINMSHYASWEWSFVIDEYVASKGFGIYLKIENKYFDRLVRKIRAKFGTTLVVTKKIREVMVQHKKDKVQAVYGFASDQSPMLHKAQHWGKFMGVMVPIHTGAEILAKTHDLAIVYMSVRKVKRGYYRAHIDVLSDNPAEIPDYQISDQFMSMLEKQIQDDPAYYFWTHKRWKHKDKVPAEYL
ncbi:MAG: lipid A biosynthesis acyltransferase [Flavobacteriaceae bacterium]|nr:lipid A biosynthesis acyltransferase [Flavobacteriaceae bacterium]